MNSNSSCDLSPREIPRLAAFFSARFSCPRLIAAGGLACVLLASAPSGRAADPVIESPRIDLSSPDGQTDLVSWPATTVPFYLEELNGLEPPMAWLPVEAPEETVGDRLEVRLPKTEGMRFFQLRHDPDLGELLLDHARQLAADMAMESEPGFEFPEIPFLDSFNPRRRAFLTSIPRTPEAGFVLVPGVWEGEFLSFCLKTGTPGPDGGSGYLPAVLRGPRADILTEVMRAVSLDESIDQETAQVLLWAILLRTQPNSMPAPTKALAEQILSADDRARLQEAANLKDRLHLAYTRRFMRLLGSVFEELPEAIRKTIDWDAQVQEAFARGELSYETIQELAFAAQMPSMPSGTARDVPYGRWSWLPATHDPNGGFLIRYLAGVYTETTIQVCVPELVTVDTDALGRITRVADLAGNEVSVTYDGAVAPLSVTGDAGVTGYAFDTIRIQGPPDPEDPRQLLEVVHQGVGWVFVGTPAGGGTPASADRFPGAAERYAFGLEQKADIARLDADLSRVHPGRPPGAPAVAARLHTMAHFCEGLRQALLAAESEEDPDFEHLEDRAGLAYRAWVSEFAAFCCGSDPGVSRGGAGLANPAPREPDILDRTVFRFLNWLFKTRTYTAKPANPDRQTFGTSSQPTAKSKDEGGVLQQEFKPVNKKVSRIFSYSKMPSFLAIPQKIIETLIDVNLQLYQHYGETMENLDKPPPRRGRLADPSELIRVRHDYTVPTLEKVWDMPPLEAGAGISAQRLAVSRELQNALLRLAAHLHAAVIAVERQRGAYQAGDDLWYDRQAAYALHHQRLAGGLMIDLADAIEDWVQVLFDEGFEDPWITRDEVEQIVEELRTQGYSDGQRDILRQIGLDDAEIERCRRLAVEGEVEGDGQAPLGGLLEFAPQLREAGRRLMALPVSFRIKNE
ncbi:MAG TPA: hypothetical protein PKM43_15570 [Verrucomicrobiota bacterium]|nr:hypothetical protein [Verrucomicrobiota bacterium]HRZ38214.1 hypothetical protein [Candidatus Paceibacterota bacterium]HRZ55689.1 hypothetical protein [Candidatus Paceibacterota bacterium]